MAANVQGLLSDPQFNALDLPTQKATLGQLDPTFAGLSDDDYKAFKTGMSAPAGPAAPPPARPPLPPGLRPGAGLLQTLSNDPNAPRDDPSLAGRLTGTSGVIPGMLRVAGGVNRFANAPSGSERAGGISDIARGSMQTAAPFTIPFGANAPVRSLVGLGAGVGTSQAVEAGAKALGVPPGYSEAAGTAAGLVAGRRASRLGGGGNRNLPPPAAPPAAPVTDAINPAPPVPEIANTPPVTPPAPVPVPGAKPPLTTGQAVGKVVTRRFIPGVSTVLRARDDYQMVRDAMRNDAAQAAAQPPQAPGPAARRPAGAAAAPATPIPQVSGSTAVPRLFQRGGNLPPQAIPPGGPQTGTVPGTVEQPPLPPQPPQGSTANMQQATQNAPTLPPTNRPPATGTIPGTVEQPPPPAPPVPGANAVQGTVGLTGGRRLPPAAVPGRTPIGSLPLNPPTNTTPANTPTTPPQTPPATPPPAEVPPAPPVPPPPASGTPAGPQVGLNSRFAKAQSANDAKVGGLQKQLVADIQSGAVTPDTIASHPNWQPHGTGGAGPEWKALARRAGVSDKFSNAPDNSPNQVLQKLGISRMMPQPAQQQQGANVPVSVSAAIQRLESGPGNYVDIPALRQELGPNADQQILQAASRENLVLAEASGANRTTDPDLLDGGNGRYYVGVARARTPAAAPPVTPQRKPATRTGSFSPGGMQVRTTYRGGKEVPPTKPAEQDIDFQQRFGEKEQPEVAKFLGHDQPASPPSSPDIRTFRFTDPRSGDVSVLAVDRSRQVNTDNIAEPSGINLDPSSIDDRIGTRWRQTLNDAGYQPQNVVGVTHMSKQGNTMHPDQVYVLPEARRQGVGTAMYDEAQKGFPAGTTLGTGLRTGPGRAFRTSYDAQKQTPPVPAPAQTTSYSVPAPSTDGFAQGDRLPHLIKSMARNLAGDYDTRVQIADLKKAMPAVSPERINMALRQMQRNGDLVLYPNDDPITIRPQDRAAAVNIGGEPRHLIYMHERTRVR